MHTQAVGRLLSAQPPAPSAAPKPPPLASVPSAESAADGDDERTPPGLENADSVLSEEQSGIASLPGTSSAKAK